MNSQSADSMDGRRGGEKARESGEEALKSHDTLQHTLTLKPPAGSTKLTLRHHAGMTRLAAHLLSLHERTKNHSGVRDRLSDRDHLDFSADWTQRLLFDTNISGPNSEHFQICAFHLFLMHNHDDNGDFHNSGLIL